MVMMTAIAIESPMVLVTVTTSLVASMVALFMTSVAVVMSAMTVIIRGR